MKISMFYGKRAESDFGAAGYILRVMVKDNAICGFVCADADENEFFVPTKNIKSVKDVLIYDKAEDIKSDCKCFTLGRPVFDCEGTAAGTLTDCIIKKYKLEYFVVGNKKIPAKDAFCGDAIILKNSLRLLKGNVVKDGKILFKIGTPFTDEIAQKATLAGEYVQANLKSLS